MGTDTVSRSVDTATVAAPENGTGVAKAGTEDTDTDRIDTVSTVFECSTVARVSDELGEDDFGRREGVPCD